MLASFFAQNFVYLAAAAVAGAFVKAADHMLDSPKGKKWLAALKKFGFEIPWRLNIALVGCAWGVILGLVAAKTDAATIYMAAIAGSLLAGKIDRTEHWAGVVSFAFAAAYFWPQGGGLSFNIILFILFAAGAYADEIKAIAKQRVVLEACALAVAAVEYLNPGVGIFGGIGLASIAFIAAFDCGYAGLAYAAAGKPLDRMRKALGKIAGLYGN